jgi:hypothetical protein
MATGSGAFGAKAGFNQSGGAYYLVVSSVRDQLLTLSPGSGSGGATTAGSLAAFSYSATVNQSSLVAANRVIRDMGKTVVSAGRSFRKFQAVVPQTLSSGGVTGDAASTTNPGYLTAYLEIARDGDAAAYNHAVIARMS